MRKPITYLVAAVLGGAMGLLSASWAGAADPAGQNERSDRQVRNNPPQLPDGFQMKDLGQLDNIRDELAKTTNTALTKDDFGKLIDRLSLVNRERTKDYKNQDFKTLDGVIDQVNKDWNAKYGHDFKISKSSDVFNDQFTIVQGVVTNPEVAAANWPVRAAEGQAQVASEREQGQIGQARDVERDNLKDAKGVALVQFSASEGLAPLTASLIQEKSHGWRIAIPDNITSQQLHTQLQNHLTALDQQKANWPADENMAYRVAAHHVFMALYNVNVPQEGRAER